MLPGLLVEEEYSRSGEGQCPLLGGWSSAVLLDYLLHLNNEDVIVVST